MGPVLALDRDLAAWLAAWRAACVLAVLGVWGLGACSYTFDDEAPAVPLVGEAPRTAELPHLNRAPCESARVLRGQGDAGTAPWVALRERGGTLRLRRLVEPPAEEELRAPQVQVLSRAVYLLDPSTDPERPSLLRVHVPGAAEADPLPLPSGDALLIVGGADDVFLYWVRAPETRSFDVIRLDGLEMGRVGFRRSIPVPEGLDPQNPQGEGLLFFDGAGQQLFVRDGKGTLRAYSTTSDATRELGARPRGLLVIDSLRALLACGDDGLWRVPWDGGEPVALDHEPCNADGLRVFWPFVYYLSGRPASALSAGELRRVLLDGGAAPAPAFGVPAQQILSASPGGELVYSLDPPRRWAQNASDGWVGAWRFMERGRLPAFSSSGGRLRWLEDAATLSGAGDLLSVDLYGAGPLRLGRNVRSFTELPDGRVLAVANYAFRGAQNRIVVLDEASRTGRWVSEGTSGYLTIPGSTDLLVQVVRDDRGFDLVRAPLPPAR